MNIWIYQNKSSEIKNDIVKSKLCIFCKNEMQEIYEEKLPQKNVWNYENIKRIKICPICGWWTVIHNYCENGHVCGEPNIYEDYGASAVLKKLDLTDISLPIDDVRQYLLVKYENRYTMHPRLFEETVAFAFRNAGYYARTTAYQNDGGIDVILDGNYNKTIGVQVKRYKNSIKVSQIREFAGSLIENNMTKGIFVTTSRFQSGVYKSVSNFKERGIGIKLIDGEKFYDALKIKKANENEYEELIDTVSKVELERIYFSEYDYNTYIKGEEKEKYNIQDDFDKLIYLKNKKGINDYNLDLWLAISKKDYAGLKIAVENGADVQCSLKELKEKYRKYIN